MFFSGSFSVGTYSSSHPTDNDSFPVLKVPLDLILVKLLHKIY